MFVMAGASNWAIFVIAWIIVGIGMAAGLYDALFSSLAQIFGTHARGLITQVTLISGLSTTLCWPLTETLVHQVGWRIACICYGVLLILAIAPIYVICLPASDHPGLNDVVPGAAGKRIPSIVRTRDFVLLAVSFSIASAIMTAISVQLLVLLRSLGASNSTALALGALIGPSQIGGRGIEMLLGRNRHPMWSFLASTLLVAMGLLLLIIGGISVGAAGVVIYGAGSGIRAIVRGTVPLALFGAERYVGIMGQIARPVLIFQAVTPLMVGYLLRFHGPRFTLAVIALLALVNVTLVCALMPTARSTSICSQR
jgi:MFS family permease